MTTDTSRAESPFSESEEQELAAELLAVNSDHELDQFLGSLLRRAASAVGSVLHSPVGGALGGLAKGAVRKVLPDVGRLFNAAEGGSTAQLAAAGRLLGLESEGMSAEDQEFNAATQLVRLTGAAAAQVSASPAPGAPTEIARQALIQSARRHAPGLVRSTPRHHHSHDCGCGGAGGSCSCKKADSGVWERRGGHVILEGV